MQIINEDQHDALIELMNIGMGRAGAALSEMIDEKVILSIPNLKFLKIEEAVAELRDSDRSDVTGIKQTFSGAFWGDALLIFPENASRILIRSLMGDEQTPHDELTDMEQEALLEVGNIVLNSCLGSIGNYFEEMISSEIPRFFSGDGHDVMAANYRSKGEDSLVMFLQMTFSIANQDIEGYTAFMVNVDSVEALRSQVDQVLGIA